MLFISQQTHQLSQIGRFLGGNQALQMRESREGVNCPHGFVGDEDFPALAALDGADVDPQHSSHVFLAPDGLPDPGVFFGSVYRVFHWCCVGVCSKHNGATPDSASIT